MSCSLSFEIPIYDKQTDNNHCSHCVYHGKKAPMMKQSIEPRNPCLFSFTGCTGLEHLQMLRNEKMISNLTAPVFTKVQL